MIIVHQRKRPYGAPRLGSDNGTEKGFREKRFINVDWMDTRLIWLGELFAVACKYGDKLWDSMKKEKFGCFRTHQVPRNHCLYFLSVNTCEEHFDLF